MVNKNSNAMLSGKIFFDQKAGSGNELSLYEDEKGLSKLCQPEGVEDDSLVVILSLAKY